MSRLDLRDCSRFGWRSAPGAATVSDMKTLLVCLVLVAGCSNRYVSHATLVASSALLAYDWGQTRCEAKGGWNRQEEMNPVLGRRPSPGAVDIYFASVIATNALVWLVTPAKYRPAAPAAIIAVQTYAVTTNAGNGMSVYCQ